MVSLQILLSKDCFPKGQGWRNWTLILQLLIKAFRLISLADITSANENVSSASGLTDNKWSTLQVARSLTISTIAFIKASSLFRFTKIVAVLAKNVKCREEVVLDMNDTYVLPRMSLIFNLNEFSFATLFSSIHVQFNSILNERERKSQEEINQCVPSSIKPTHLKL